VERQADGELRFRRPNGDLIPEISAPLPVFVDAAEWLRTDNRTNGIHIDAQTSKPDWLGDRLDLGYAIDVRHPAATGERVSH
jgi:hypothetical protein